MKKTLLIVVVLVLIGFAFWRWNAPSKVEMGDSTLTAQKNEGPLVPSSAKTNVASESTETSVSISNFTFSPNRTQVKKGETIVWTNKDTAAHTVTSNSGIFDSHSLQKDASFSFSFTKAGTYSYHCSFHPSMHGVIEVTE